MEKNVFERQKILKKNSLKFKFPLTMDSNNTIF